MIIKADRDTLTITEDQNTYSGAKDYYQITFQFSEDWDAFAVRHAVFIRSATEVEDVVIPSNGMVEIPNVFLEYESAIEVGCYGISGEIRRTTNLVKLIVEEGSYRAGERAVPAPDIFQQYLDQIIAYTGSIDFNSALKDVPAGGATGQVLAKKSDTDFDTEWRTESAQQQGIPTGGSSGQVLAKASASDYDVTWQDDAQTDSLADTAVMNTSSDSRYTGLSTQKLINEKISTDIAAKADTAHNHDSVYLGISHGSQTDNPHGVTKTHVGLGNADNTSDMNKPVSTAVQTAIDSIDQVFSYTNLAAFPAAGAAETIYIAEDTNKTYRWTGSAYAEIGGGTGGGSSGREVLTADRIYYVDPVGGSDSNTGLSASVPFLTIQKAIDETAALDLGIYDVTIDLWTATGSGTATYSVTTAVQLKKLIGAGNVTIQGNISDQTSVVITGSSSINFIEAESLNGYTIDLAPQN